MKLNFLVVRKILIYTFVFNLIFVSGYALGYFGINATFSFNKGISLSREVPAHRQNVDFSLFWQIWDTLESSYYDQSKLNTNKMIYGAISGMVASLGDPYTAFLAPEENKVVEEDLSGSFEGVGIQIGFKGKNLAVIAPLPDSPAEEAGVKAGDFIVGIQDQAKNIDTSTSGMSLNDAVKLIRGKAGTKVTLVLLRDNLDEPIKVELIRRFLDVPSVVLEYKESGKVAHVKLLKFGGDTKGEWDKAVLEIVDKNAKYIIIDLRNNPGGYLQAAVDIASDFVDINTTIVIEDKGGLRQEFKTNKKSRLSDRNVVLLVNSGSASASEILAGALSELKGYKIVGQKTFGKGTIQEPLQLNNGASLHLTTAKWLTPKGNWINETGLIPDLEVADNDETVEDEQLQEAVKIVL